MSFIIPIITYRLCLMQLVLPKEHSKYKKFHCLSCAGKKYAMFKLSFYSCWTSAVESSRLKQIWRYSRSLQSSKSMPAMLSIREIR